MADIGLVWDRERGAADLGLAGGDLVGDEGLETALMLSLFTDRRAEAGDVLPDGEADRRGWWADAVPVVEGDRWGSRLWLLARSKQTAETLARAEDYAREALAWLLTDKVAERVDVLAEAVANDVLGLSVTLHRPKGDSVQYRYNYTWVSQEARRVG